MLRTVVLRLPAGVNPPHTSSWLLCSEGLCLFLEGWGVSGEGSGMCWKRVSPFTLDAGAPQARGQIKLPHPPVSHAENMDLVRFINSYPPQRRMKLHHVSFRRSHKFILWQAAEASNTCILQLPLCSVQGNLEHFCRKDYCRVITVFSFHTSQQEIKQKISVSGKKKTQLKENLWWSTHFQNMRKNSQY